MISFRQIGLLTAVALLGAGTLAAAEAVAVTNASAATAAPNAAKAKAQKPKKASRPARITAATTYYDRKEGVAILTGNVYVNDDEYQLHADKAFVFMNGTNDLERIVAVGNVAMTNENKRAYGAKVSYYRNRGMVVLHSDENRAAEVREVKPDGDQIVRGRKIRFWIDSEQVEVLEAVIDASTSLGGAKLNPLR